jgi:hypothetical protein
MKLIPYVFIIVIISGLLFFYQTTPYMNLNQGLDTIYIGQTYVDPGATIKIGNETYDMSTEDIVNGSLLGKQELTYVYTFENQIYTITRYVMVIEHDQFEMTLNPGVDTIRIGEPWVDAGVTTSHDINVNVISNVNRLRAGTYEVTYQVTYLDASFELTRYVTVISR